MIIHESEVRVYDADQARRARNRQLEQHNRWLREHVARCHRIIGILAQAAAGQEAQPLAVLQVAEAIDEVEQRLDFTPSQLVELLRRTSP